MPMATPPRMRQVMNWLKLAAQPVSTEETANRAARKNEQLFPADPVAQGAGDERAGQATERGRNCWPIR